MVTLPAEVKQPAPRKVRPALRAFIMSVHSPWPSAEYAYFDGRVCPPNVAWGKETNRNWCQTRVTVRVKENLQVVHEI